MNDSEWFDYWNRQLWTAVKEGDEKAEAQAIAFLYCLPVNPQ